VQSDGNAGLPLAPAYQPHFIPFQLAGTGARVNQSGSTPIRQILIPGIRSAVHPTVKRAAILFKNREIHIPCAMSQGITGRMHGAQQKCVQGSNLTRVPEKWPESDC